MGERGLWSSCSLSFSPFVVTVTRWVGARSMLGSLGPSCRRWMIDPESGFGGMMIRAHANQWRRHSLFVQMMMMMMMVMTMMCRGNKHASGLKKSHPDFQTPAGLGKQAGIGQIDEELAAS
jgi:hypothetical protein